MRAILCSCALLLAWLLCAVPAEEDRRAEAIRLWTEGITDISGLSALTPFSGVPYDDQDLKSICAMKLTVLENALQATGDYLAHLNSLPEAQRDDQEIMKLHHQLAQLAMYRGDAKEAIGRFQSAYEIARKLNLTTFEESLEEKLGISHLRLGEMENCVHHRNVKSCIFPISPEARHSLTAGSQSAVEFFLRILRRDPSNLAVRWLLNVAYMTLGQYPQKVPKEYLIPPTA